VIGTHVLASVFVGAAVTTLGAATQPGQIVQLTGPGACASQLETEGLCAPARAINAPDALALSPDGRTLYVASYGVSHIVSGNPGSLAVFARDPASGRITQAQESSGCLGSDFEDGCSGARGLDGASGVVVSADGRHVYATGLQSNSIAAFARAPAGTLTQLPGTNGCLTADGSNGCAAAPGLYGASDLALTRDGRSIYAAAVDSKAVSSYARDPATGRLTQLAGAAGCIHQRPDEDEGEGAFGVPPESCAAGNGLTGPGAVEVSPDGTSVYVLSDSSLAIFRRAPNGTLSQLSGPQGCLSGEETGGTCTASPGLVAALGLAIAPDGRTVYVTSYFPGAILPFRRDPASGALSPLSPLTTGNSLEGLADLVITRDGSHLYATAPARDAVLAFAVRAGGSLVQLPGLAGCVSDVESEDSCSHGEVLARASAVEISPDSRHVYVTAVEPIGLGCACGRELGSVSAFARTPASLTVAKASPPAGGIHSGQPFRISARVKTSATSITVACTVRAGGRAVATSGRYAGGVASCAGIAPKASRGKRLSGVLKVTAGGAIRRVSFTYPIR
jgi:DNA-binding beta-propeller fold protein YncE